MLSEDTAGLSIHENAGVCWHKIGAESSKSRGGARSGEESELKAASLRKTRLMRVKEETVCFQRKLRAAVGSSEKTSKTVKSLVICRRS